jgi:hypothetical protein
MAIRNITLNDIPKLIEIHDKFYKHEFSFPNFFDNFRYTLVITDDGSDKIITACGARPILEMIAITDKSFPATQRISALTKVLQASEFIVSKLGFDQIHAFVQDNNWEEILKKVGFSECKGKALYLNIK